MKYLRLLLPFLLGLSAVSCCGQPISSKAWKTYEFAEPGVRADFPCEPKLSEKVFQEKPRIARSFSIVCTHEGYDFSISLPERFGDYQLENVERELQESEDTLRIVFDDKARLTSTPIVFRTYLAREFSIRNDWTIGRQLVVAHERGLYSVQISRPDRTSTLSGKQITEFETIAKKFIGSFDLLK